MDLPETVAVWMLIAFFGSLGAGFLIAAGVGLAEELLRRFLEIRKMLRDEGLWPWDQK